MLGEEKESRMPIKMLSDPDDWPIRYVAITTDVTRAGLRAWIEEQPPGIDLTVQLEPGALSSGEVRAVAEEYVSRLDIRLAQGDEQA